MEDEEKQPLLMVKRKDRSEPQVDITFEDMGIPTRRRLYFSVLGETRPCGEIGLTDRVYIGLVLLSLTATVVPTICQLSMPGTQTDDYRLCWVLLINAAFCVWYIWEGVLKERASEIAVLTLSTAINMTYIVVSYMRGHRTRLTSARLTVTAVFCPVLVILGLILTSSYYLSRRLIFRTVGANSRLQSFYIILLVFQDLLKLDLQLGVSSVMFAVNLAGPMTTQDISLLSVGVTFAVAWSSLGLCAMPRESRVGAYLFFIFSPAQIAYLTCILLNNSASSTGGHVEMTSADAVCYIAGLTVHLGVVFTAIVVFTRFGHGLKDQLQRKQPVRTPQVRWMS